MNLKGRRALITGATGGIGMEIAATIAECGGSLLLVDRPGSDYSSLKEKIYAQWDVDIKCMDCDLEDEQDRKNLLRGINNNIKGLDILVNNAAFVGESDLSGWVTTFEKQTIETWRRAIEVNLTAVFHLVQGCVSMLKESQSSSIINVASIYGVNGPDYSLYEDTQMGNPAAYAASKGGLIQLTRWLATTLAPHIRVNAISPGGVFRNQPEQFVSRYEARTPLGRMARNDDFKGVMAFLASDLSAYITGQNILVDGGWTAW